MIEKTFMMVKPDGVKRGLIGAVISRVEQRGLKVVGLRMVWVDKAFVSRHYTDDKSWIESLGKKAIDGYEKKGIKVKETAFEIGMRVREGLMDYITSGPVAAMVVEGHDAVEQVRKLVGSTSPHMAQPGTIRGDFSVDSYMSGDHHNRPIRNMVHASGNKAEAENEIKLWFSSKDVHSYKRVDEEMIYGN